MTRLIEISREWHGQTAAIFASGPSMTAEVAERCRGLRTIAINNQSMDCAPWADIIYGSDAKWWRHYLPVIIDLPGRKISVQIGSPIQGVDYLRASKEVCDTRPTFLSTGANSGYAALCLAVKLGAARVLLYGYDMAPRNGRYRRHDYPANLNSKPRFAEWIPRYRTLALELKRRGVDVINCTPGSALTCFPFQSASPALAVPC
jgi:hypothetical protein